MKDGLVRLSILPQGLAQTTMDLRAVRLQLQLMFERGDRLMRPPCLKQHRREIIMAAWRAWRKLDGFLEFNQCFFRLAGLEQRIAQIIMGIRGCRLNDDGAAEMQDSFIYPSQIEQRGSQIAVCINGIGLHLQGLFKMDYRFSIAALGVQKVAKTNLRQGRIGI